MCSATGAQMVSSSVQKALTLSSSSVSSTKLPVRHEASEKIRIKQVFGSEEKTAGEFLCLSVCPPPSNVDKKSTSGHQMPFFFLTGTVKYCLKVGGMFYSCDQSEQKKRTSKAVESILNHKGEPLADGVELPLLSYSFCLLLVHAWSISACAGSPQRWWVCSV